MKRFVEGQDRRQGVLLPEVLNDWVSDENPVRAIEAMQDRLDLKPDAMRIRRATVEHPFGTMKAWMGATHFKMRTLAKVPTEMSLQVLAYNFRRVIEILGVRTLIAAMQA